MRCKQQQRATSQLEQRLMRTSRCYSKQWAILTVLLVLKLRPDRVRSSHCCYICRHFRFSRETTNLRQTLYNLWASPVLKLNIEMWPEALPSLIIIAGCITITGLGLKYLDRYQNGGKVCTRYLPTLAVARSYTKLHKL